MKICYYSELVPDGFGTIEGSSNPDKIERVLLHSEEWSEEMLFHDENDKKWSLEELEGRSVFVNGVVIKISEDDAEIVDI